MQEHRVVPVDAGCYDFRIERASMNEGQDEIGAESGGDSHD